MDAHHHILKQTEAYVKQLLSGEGSGHDWWHIHRVRNLALTIGATENADFFIVELSALLHDVGDHKLHNGDETVAERMITGWLQKLNVDEKVIQQVNQVVQEISFKGANVKHQTTSLEAQVVQDADRLDAIGAIGIARTFAFGGHHNREMYNPEIKPTMHTSFDAYKNDKGHTINHFYEKLLLLKNLMNTNTAKAMAHKRHLFMEDYLQQFYAEWEGRA